MAAKTKKRKKPVARAATKKARRARTGNPSRFDKCVASVAAKGRARSPRGVCASAGRKKYGAKKFAQMAAAGRLKKHKNPEELAADKYREWHGRDAEDVTEVEETIHEHDWLSGIGKLHSLTILAVDRTEVVLDGFKGALLAQDEKSKQLFIVGGDQSVSLKDFGIQPNAAHEQEMLGFAKVVEYITRKDHLGKAGGAGEKSIHRHPFGSLRQVDAADPRAKKGSRLPAVIYDVRNRKLSFAGGGYDLPEVGIRG